MSYILIAIIAIWGARIPINVGTFANDAACALAAEALQKETSATKYLCVTADAPTKPYPKVMY